MTYVVGLAFLALINLAFIIRFALAVSSNLQNGYNYSKLIETRHLANRALIFGVLACITWSTITWVSFTYLYLPSNFKILLGFSVFFLLGANLLIPLHCEERVSVSF